ncbi:transposase InsO family protein [Puniceicoccus vermicola]
MERRGKEMETEAVVDWVNRERAVQPQLGGLKLHHRMKEQEVPFQLGRDRFFDLLREKDLLVKPEPSTPRTTQWKEYLPVFPNIVAERPAEAPEEVWLCDLTYIATDEGFQYLFLISDQFSRKIVGYHLSDTMETTDALEALRKACGSLTPGKKPRHHSDRGCQYCSHKYVNELHNRGISVSMTEVNHCYENSQAERLNGILKQEYGLGRKLPSKAMAAKMVEHAIECFNTIRPHRALEMNYPERVHRRPAPVTKWSGFRTWFTEKVQEMVYTFSCRFAILQSSAFEVRRSKFAISALPLQHPRRNGYRRSSTTRTAPRRNRLPTKPRGSD